jgi:hypothetical protein
MFGNYPVNSANPAKFFVRVHASGHDGKPEDSASDLRIGIGNVVRTDVTLGRAGSHPQSRHNRQRQAKSGSQSKVISFPKGVVFEK